MAVAFYNEAGKGDPFELPALYLLLALVLVVAGPGALAVDRTASGATHQKVNASRFSSSFFGVEAGHRAERGEIGESGRWPSGT